MSKRDIGQERLDGIQEIIAFQEIDMITASEINCIFEEYFGIQLQKEGFLYVNDRKWIRRRMTEITDVFQIQALKGDSYSPLWGFSLNFIPHISGDKLRYHNSDKNVMLDYRYDPLDIKYGNNDQYKDFIISRLHGAENAKQKSKRLSERVIPMALSLFSKISNIAELGKLYLESLQAHREKRSYRFGFFNYAQYPIAYAFILSRQGKYDEGVAVLKEANDRGGINDSAGIYEKVFEKLLSKMKQQL